MKKEKKKKTKAPHIEPDETEAPDAQTGLTPKQELFCQYYTQHEATFGNATLSYAAAYNYDLGDIQIFDEAGNHIFSKQYQKKANVCAVEGHRNLRRPKVKARIDALLAQLLKDEIVDGQLAKVIMQDAKLESKVAAIREYNKVRGRIIDKTKVVTDKFSMDDIRSLLDPLPQERQDEIYAILTAALAEAELLRSGAQTQGGGTQQS